MWHELKSAQFVYMTLSYTVSSIGSVCVAMTTASGFLTYQLTMLFTQQHVHNQIVRDSYCIMSYYVYVLVVEFVAVTLLLSAVICHSHALNCSRNLISLCTSNKTFHTHTMVVITLRSCTNLSELHYYVLFRYMCVCVCVVLSNFEENFSEQFSNLHCILNL